MQDLVLSLVKITNKLTGKVTYCGVNDKHYDGMLASGGCWELEKEWEWTWLGDVSISLEILGEEGFTIPE